VMRHGRGAMIHVRPKRQRKKKAEITSIAGR